MPDDRLFHKTLGHSAKVNRLTAEEEIVWRTYIQAADDFGVMRFSVEPLCDAHDRLANIRRNLLRQMLERVFEIGLVQKFEHQNRLYCYQCDWQKYQKVRYAGRTIHPRIPSDLLTTCDLPTQWLHTIWPGGGGREFKLTAWHPTDDWTPPDWATQRSGSGNGSGNGGTPYPHPHTSSVPVHVPALASAPAPACEPGQRTVAAAEDPTLRDRFEEFWDLYPCKVGQDSAWMIWIALAPDRGLTDTILAAIDHQRRSAEWQKEQGRYIPHPQNWLKKQRWTDRFPVAALAGTSRKTAGNPNALQGFVGGGRTDD